VPESSPAFWAFLSYSSHDRASAMWLHRALETYKVPRRLVGRPTPAGPPAPRRFRPVFRDRAELAANDDLSARIASVLAQSAYLIVICSRDAAKSRWVDEEILRFRALHGGSRILAVIAEDLPEDAPQDCFPAALRQRLDATGNPQPYEPIAADPRPSGDGRRMARLKLLAAMLGVGLDELVRRDSQRRHRQMVGITAASVAGLVVAGALATAALIARNEAQRQRAHAEGLIEFMLTDLRKKLEPSGRLDAMDGVGREALDYYAAQDPVHVDAQSLARRARALRLMGEIRVQRGDLGDALKNFEQASAATEELLARSPDDGQIIFNHAQNVFWVGEIAHQRGDRATAEGQFTHYRALAEQLSGIDPSNDDWQAEVAYADSALGVLYLEEGRAADAVAMFERSLAVAEGLARHRPDDSNVQLEVGQGHAWLADALEKQGRLGATRAHRETELVIYRAVLAKDGTVRQAKFSTIVALQRLGSLAMLAGDRQGALTDFSESAERAEALLSSERDNMDLTAAVAFVHVDRGEALLALGRVAAARAAQQRADELLAVALGHDAAVALWRNYRDSAALLAGAIAAASGQPAQAVRIDQAVLRRLDTEPGPAVNTEPFWLLQRSRLQTGNDLAALGRAQDAREAWAAVLTSLSGPIEGYEPKLLAVLAAAEGRLGRTADSQVVARRLRDLSRPDAG
jgi:tetratricopeptide (TPR) repeat protein